VNATRGAVAEDVETAVVVVVALVIRKINY
jgi:hypothetical protein